MIAFLWTMFGINLLAGISHFVGLKKSLSVRADVFGLLLDLGIAGWALYFIISGAR